MSSNSNSHTIAKLLEALHLTVPAACNPDASTVEMAEKARISAISRLIMVSDPADVASIVDNLLAWGFCAMASAPEFFTRTDLMNRYQKSRKWVERLPLRPSKMGGAWLYPRADVLTYEEECAAAAVGPSK